MKKLRLQDQHPDLQAAIASPNVTLTCNPGTRRYGVLEMLEGRTPRRYAFPARPKCAAGDFPIYFCPFTGDMLPGDLHDTQGRIIRRKHGLEFADMFEDKRRIPIWASREDWWLERRIGFRPQLDYIEVNQKHPPMWPWVANTPRPDLPERFLAKPGYRRSVAEPPHYCNCLSIIFSRDKYLYWYLPHTREYGPRIIDPDQRIDYQPIRILPVGYCPWCGEEHPKSLRPEWEKRVMKAGFDPDNPEDPDFVKNLLSDDWWKADKRFKITTPLKPWEDPETEVYALYQEFCQFYMDHFTDYKGHRQRWDAVIEAIKALEATET